MLRQISSIVEDEVSEMPEPDVVPLSPRQSEQLKYGSSHYSANMLYYWKPVFLWIGMLSTTLVWHHTVFV